MLIRRRIPIVLALMAGGLALLALALTATAAPLATTRSYPGAAPCDTTLQACIVGSNAGDQINIAAGTYITSFTLNKTVSLVGASQSTTILRALAGNRTITVTSAVTNGTLISNLTLQGGTLASGNGGVMWVQTGAQPTLQYLTIQSGTVTATTSFGGGLFTQADLTLTNVSFIANTAHEEGGGLLATGNITLNGGTFNGNVSQDERGGAMTVGGNLVVNGTTISNNQAFDSGGAILVTGTTTINNALIVNNRSTAGSGGALRAVGTTHISGTQFISNQAFNPGGGMRTSTAVFLTNTTFLSNTAGVGGGDNRGGGLFANAAATINGGLFQANSAGTGGGAQVVGALVISGTTFNDNAAGLHGGGLTANTASIQNATFARNRVLVGNGGGLAVTNTLAITRSVFSQNQVLSGTANTSTGNGGGIYGDGAITSLDNVFLGNFAQRLGGGMDADDLVSVWDQFRGNLTGPQGSGGGLFVAGVFELDGGLFYTNTANTAGGLGVNSSASGDVFNSLFARNVVTFTDGGSAMRLLSNGDVTLHHNTLVGTSQAGRAAILVTNNGAFLLYNNIFAHHSQGIKNMNFPTATVTEDYSVFFNVGLPHIPVTLTVGPSTLTADPRFANPAAGDYRLAFGSPAIDSAYFFIGLDHDFEGQTRPMGNDWDRGFDEALPARVFLPLARR
jgi:predicted outer membrane repeat protein